MCVTSNYYHYFQHYLAIAIVIFIDVIVVHNNIIYFLFVLQVELATAVPSSAGLRKDRHKSSFLKWWEKAKK